MTDAIWASIFGFLGALVLFVGQIIVQAINTRANRGKTRSEEELNETQTAQRLVELSEKVRIMVEEALGKQITEIKLELSQTSSDLTLYKRQNDDLKEELEKQKASSKNKISKLEKKMIDGYQVILKLLALLKEHRVDIPLDLQKEIELLRPQDTQQLPRNDPEI